MKFNDFYNVEYPEVLIELGFKDESYHNDGAGFLYNEELKLGVYVSDEKPELREMDDWLRFYLVGGTREDLCSGTGREILGSEFQAPIIAAIRLEKMEAGIRDHSLTVPIGVKVKGA